MLFPEFMPFDSFLSLDFFSFSENQDQGVVNDAIFS